MKKLILTIIALSILTDSVYAETYAVERSDGGVSIIYYQEGSGDSLETVIKDLGFTGYPIKKIIPSDFPTDRSDRNYWKLNDVPVGKKVVIDTDKKQADETAKAAKEVRKQALLKMTPAEYSEAKELGIIQ